MTHLGACGAFLSKPKTQRSWNICYYCVLADGYQDTVFATHGN